MLEIQYREKNRKGRYMEGAFAKRQDNDRLERKIGREGRGERSAEMVGGIEPLLRGRRTPRPARFMLLLKPSATIAFNSQRVRSAHFQRHFSRLSPPLAFACHRRRQYARLLSSATHRLRGTISCCCRHAITPFFRRPLLNAIIAT